MLYISLSMYMCIYVYKYIHTCIHINEPFPWVILYGPGVLSARSLGSATDQLGSLVEDVRWCFLTPELVQVR